MDQTGVPVIKTCWRRRQQPIEHTFQPRQWPVDWCLQSLETSCASPLCAVVLWPWSTCDVKSADRKKIADSDREGTKKSIRSWWGPEGQSSPSGSGLTCLTWPPAPTFESERLSLLTPWSQSHPMLLLIQLGSCPLRNTHRRLHISSAKEHPFKRTLHVSHQKKKLCHSLTSEAACRDNKRKKSIPPYQVRKVLQVCFVCHMETPK